MPAPHSWLEIAALLGAGFFLLAKGADWLVGGSVQVARRFGLSPIFVGLTVVAFGTSVPEIVVSTLAAVRGEGGMSLGNVLGSNVANIGLVLGLCALVLPQTLRRGASQREVFWLFVSVIVLGWMLEDGALDRVEGGFLLLLFVAFNLHLLATARDPGPPSETVMERPRAWLWIAIGIGSVALGARLVVDGGVSGAARLGVPDEVVGLTVLAVGTSLPELAAGLTSALRGESDISLGNVIGSNVFNVLAALGLVCVIHPLDPARFGDEGPALRRTFADALAIDLPIVLAFSLAMVLLPKLLPGKGRLSGLVLVLAYAGYVTWLYTGR